MSASALPRMTADEFIAWAMEQPEGDRYELDDGEIVAMSPQRSGHALTAFRAARRLADAIERADLPCTVYGDGMAVAIDAKAIYQPDAMLRCGPALADDAVSVDDPLVVVEVLSRSSRSLDTQIKLAGYFRIAMLRHYLIVAYDSKIIIHHHRDDSGTIMTRIIHDGAVRLDPPGIELRDLFS
jgi:Uma2 family endonuclease